MPITPTYPGVYIEEVSSGVHPITGVATSITAFVGFAPRGPVNTPIQVQSFTEYIRVFGGLAADSTMSYAVNQYFQNGGSQAIIVRAAHLTGGGNLAKVGKLSIGTVAAKTLKLEAANPGIWSAKLLARIDADTSDPATLFNLSIKDPATGEIEVFRNLPVGPSIGPLIASQSQLVRAVSPFPTALPDRPHRYLTGRRSVRPTRGDAATRRSRAPGRAPAPTATTTRRTSSRRPTTGRACGRSPARISSTSSSSRRSSRRLRPTDRFLSGTAKNNAAGFCFTHRAFFLVDPYPGLEAPGRPHHRRELR